MTIRIAKAAGIGGKAAVKMGFSVRAAVVLTAVLLAAVPQIAQAGELRRAEVVKELNKQYAETPKAVGVTNGGNIIEIFTSETGATWTLVLTAADGNSRVIAVGETWIEHPPAAAQ